MECKKGSVLILSIWVMLFLCTLTVVSGSVARQEILLAGKIEEKNELYSLASSGALMAIEYMRTYYEKNKTLKTDALNSQWSDLPEAFKSTKMGNGSFSVRYEQVDNVSNKKKILYGIVDEERKINVNYINTDTIARLITNKTGMKPEKALGLAENVIDWRDLDDNMGSKEPATSEGISYKNGGFKYKPRNLPFKTIEELLLVKDMDFSVFSAIRDHITVYGSSKININTASKTVLIALGMSLQVANQIVLFRSGPDMKEGTADDNIITSLKSVGEDISVFGVLPQKDKEKLTDLIFMNILDIKSTCMRVNSVSNIFSGKMYGEVVCVFDKEGSIEYWGYRYFV